MTARPQRRPACLQCPSPAKIKRPKNGHALCIAHFLSTFETEVLQTMETSGLFSRGETIAIGASGGKDSTVLASVLSTLNTRHNLGLNLHLLSIDEGIVGYRDHSLATVQRNARQYGLPLTVLSYRELYGWTMDDVVATVGKKSNCTYCGVFRRQALDRGCEMLNISHVVTGHNADDMAETVLMNLLRGDLPRLARCTAITTRSSSSSSSSSDASATVRRSKPLKYAYQKEIVLYAHHRKLDYFTTECTYAPEAFRGSARDLVKALERVRPTAIMDILRSGEAFAGLLRPTDGNRTLVPPQKCAEKECTCSDSQNPCHGKTTTTATTTTTKNSPSSSSIPLADEEDSLGTCSSTSFASGEGAMHIHEAQLRNLHHHHHHHHTTETPSPSSPSPKNPTAKRKQQLLRSCTQCGYLTSQDLCQACVMLQSLNRSRPAVMVQIEHDG